MKKAFTLLELVFVIVVIGILSAIIIPSTRTNPVREASTQLVSHIRYAQHLAMVDDKYDATNTSWYKNRWQVVFENNSYSIMSDNTLTNAKEPINDGSDIDVDLNDKYSTTLSFNNNCPLISNKMYLSFDNLGRPLLGDLNNYTSAYMATTNEKKLEADCIITLRNDLDTVEITITPETGYVTNN